MEFSLEVIVFYLLLIDSIGANLTAWFGEKWYNRHLKPVSRYFPLGKGWTTYYLILVLWIGFLLHRFGVL